MEVSLIQCRYHCYYYYNYFTFSLFIAPYVRQLKSVVFGGHSGWIDCEKNKQSVLCSRIRILFRVGFPTRPFRSISLRTIRKIVLNPSPRPPSCVSSVVKTRKAKRISIILTSCRFHGNDHPCKIIRQVGVPPVLPINTRRPSRFERKSRQTLNFITDDVRLRKWNTTWYTHDGVRIQRARGHLLGNFARFCTATRRILGLYISYARIDRVFICTCNVL